MWALRVEAAPSISLSFVEDLYERTKDGEREERIHDVFTKNRAKQGTLSCSDAPHRETVSGRHQGREDSWLQMSQMLSQADRYR
jgi:hypothetical protein